MTPPGQERKTVPLAMGLLALSAAFLVGGYEFARTSVASLFIGNFGADKMSYAMALAPAAIAALIYLYARLLSLAGPMRAFLLCFAAAFAVFASGYAAVKAGHGAVIAPLYIFTEVYIVILVEQYWSMVNSTLTSAEAKIYNGPIAGVGAVGPIAAGMLMKRFAGEIGTETFLLLSAATLVPAALFSWLSFRFVGEPKPSEREAGGKSGHLHLSLIKNTPPLGVLMGVIFLTQVLSTAYNLEFYGLAQQAFPAQDARTAYLGGFWLKVNIIAAAMQFVITPFLMRNVSLRIIMFVIPLLHLANGLALIFAQSLPMAALAFMTFKGLDYSLFRASKETLYIPLSYDARYRAKQVIDAFGNRFSKGATGAALSAWNLSVGAVSALAYSIIGSAAAALWLLLSFPLTKKYPARQDAS